MACITTNKTHTSTLPNGEVIRLLAGYCGQTCPGLTQRGGHPVRVVSEIESNIDGVQREIQGNVILSDWKT